MLISADPGFAAAMEPQVALQVPQTVARLSGIPDPAPTRAIPLPSDWDADPAVPAPLTQPTSVPSAPRPFAEWPPHRREGDPSDPVAEDPALETLTILVAPPLPILPADLPTASPAIAEPAIQADPPAKPADPGPPPAIPRSTPAALNAQPPSQADQKNPLATNRHPVPFANLSDRNLPPVSDPQPTLHPALQSVRGAEAQPVAAPRQSVGVATQPSAPQSPPAGDPNFRPGQPERPCHTQPDRRNWPQVCPQSGSRPPCRASGT